MKQLASKIIRYWKLFWVLTRLSVMSVLMYRVNSLFMAITPIVWAGTMIAFVSIIFSGNKTFGGWNYWETMLLLGIHELIFLGSWLIFIGNLERFIQEMPLGKFDRILLRPVNHRFLISFNSVDLTTVGGLLNALVIIAVSLSHLTIKFNLLTVVFFLIALIIAYLVVYLVYFSVASLSLFFIQAEIFTDWLQEMMDFGRYPAEIYSNYFRFFLLFGFPVLFFSYVPTAILLGKLPLSYVFWGILVVFWLYIISTIIWRKGLKSYQSASS